MIYSPTYSATIGYWRGDGDFRVLVGLNNVDGEVGKFVEWVAEVAAGLQKRVDGVVVAYEREDLPDYISDCDMEDSVRITI